VKLRVKPVLVELIAVKLGCPEKTKEEEAETVIVVAVPVLGSVIVRVPGADPGLIVMVADVVLATD
jgi:hypothetical protein